MTMTCWFCGRTNEESLELLSKMSYESLSFLNKNIPKEIPVPLCPICYSILRASHLYFNIERMQEKLEKTSEGK